jgi:ABC-type bacteriocin/lantibiotic exporter with double-glycine peptidase domain
VVIDKVVVNNALSTMMILLIALLSANLFEIGVFDKNNIATPNLLYIR